MRIYHITSHYPPHLGGMEHVVQQIATRQAVTDDVTVITSNIGTDSQHIASTREDEVSVTRLPTKIFAHTPFMRGLFKTLIHLPPKSIIHLHIAQVLMPEIVLVAAKLRGHILISHIHSDIGASGRLGILLPIYKKVFWSIVLRNSTKIIVPTTPYETIAIQQYCAQREKISVIPAGVDDIFMDNNLLKKAFSNDTMHLLFVGRLCIEKNVDILIDSLDALDFKVVFHIVGDGPLRDQLEAKVSKMPKNQSKIIFHGRQEGRALKELYLSADLLLLASTYESQSLVAMEAICCETPVVFSDLPAVAEIVDDAGVQVSLSAASFTQTLSRLRKDPARFQSLRESCIDRRSFFSWESTLQKIYEVYKQ